MVGFLLSLSKRWLDQEIDRMLVDYPPREDT